MVVSKCIRARGLANRAAIPIPTSTFTAQRECLPRRVRLFPRPPCPPRSFAPSCVPFALSALDSAAPSPPSSGATAQSGYAELCLRGRVALSSVASGPGAPVGATAQSGLSGVWTRGRGLSPGELGGVLTFANAEEVSARGLGAGTRPEVLTSGG